MGKKDGEFLYLDKFKGVIFLYLRGGNEK